MQLKRNKEMEFETLKKSHKKQIIIGAIAVCILGGALTFNLTKAKYRIDKSIDLAKGTVNYKPYDFKIMAMYKSDDGSNYTEIDTMPTFGYIINEDKSYCTTDNKTQVKGKIKTVNNKHYITMLSKRDKCYLYFDKKNAITIGNNEIEYKTDTPTTFAIGATTDEGVYAVKDEMYGGISYYWRGLVTNNYVKFANFCWRIIRINGDDSIRIIYDGTICHANGSNSDRIAKTDIAYNTSNNRSNYVGWTYEGTSQRPSDNTAGTASNAKIQLESWYSSNITGTNANKVADGKFCNDRNAQTENTWAISPSSVFYYAPYKRIYTDHSPSLACNLGDIYTLKVGLITVDEAMYAGGTNANNASYYLYNGYDYWTMSPYYWDISAASMFHVNSLGNLNWRYLNGGRDGYTSGLRPVINLRSDVIFSGGDGTLDNPYVVQ